MTRWDVELRIKPSYKTAVSALTSKRKGSPTLETMRKWLDEIIKQPSTHFFLRNSEQDSSFHDLKRIPAQELPQQVRPLPYVDG